MVLSTLLSPMQRFIRFMNHGFQLREQVSMLWSVMSQRSLTCVTTTIWKAPGRIILSVWMWVEALWMERQTGGQFNFNSSVLRKMNWNEMNWHLLVLFGKVFSFVWLLKLTEFTLKALANISTVHAVKCQFILFVNYIILELCYSSTKLLFVNYVCLFVNHKSLLCQLLARYLTDMPPLPPSDSYAN